ncbi:MAG: hypothetical protein ACRDZW_03350, partial [Acidimicrobiales bacterium]
MKRALLSVLRELDPISEADIAEWRRTHPSDPVRGDRGHAAYGEVRPSAARRSRPILLGAVAVGAAALVALAASLLSSASSVVVATRVGTVGTVDTAPGPPQARDLASAVDALSTFSREVLGVEGAVAVVREAPTLLRLTLPTGADLDADMDWSAGLWSVRHLAVAS